MLALPFGVQYLNSEATACRIIPGIRLQNSRQAAPWALYRKSILAKLLIDPRSDNFLLLIGSSGHLSNGSVEWLC